MTQSDHNDRITSTFGFESTAADVAAGTDLNGKRAIVTGGASGIGTETARVLSSIGAHVTIAARDIDAGKQVAAAITAETGNPIGVGRLDLADLASVTAYAAAWDGPLDLLINNAGIMALPDLQLTLRGQELQFATNHLGHFALATHLHRALAAAEGARVVSLSSRGHQRSDVFFDDLAFQSRSYHPYLGYGQSKTANVLFAVEGNRRWSADGITVNAVHPGAIGDTNLGRHMDPAVFADLMASIPTTKTLEQGAATTVFVATSDLLDGKGGRYFENCNEAEVLTGDEDNPPGGVESYALDPNRAERLWEVSERLIA